MKNISNSNKLKVITTYLYIAPLIAANYLIFSTGHLIGDFISVDIEISIWRLFYLDLIYLFPLLLVIVSLKLNFCNYKNKENLYIKSNSYKNFLFILIIINIVLSLLFGVIPVGGRGESGLIGAFQALNNKLNPYILLIMLSSLGLKKYQFFLSCISIILFSVLQKSILGFFIVFISTYVYIVMNTKINFKMLLFFLTLPLIFIIVFNDFLQYIYESRNLARGLETQINPEDNLSLAIGRINSFSSLYSIYSCECYYGAVSNFYTLSSVLQRFTSYSLLENIDTTTLFNLYYIGDDISKYAIFTSTAGALLILLQSDLWVIIFNCIFIILIINASYYLMPYPPNKYKFYVFLLLFYLTYLSGDIWELTILLQSLVLIKILSLIYFKLFYKKKLLER
jgi:hypothetical protein